jgi:hypothetical protein
LGGAPSFEHLLDFLEPFAGDGHANLRMDAGKKHADLVDLLLLVLRVVEFSLAHGLEKVNLFLHSGIGFNPPA